MTQRTGFALLTPEQRSAVSRMGGHAVPPGRRSFSTDRDLAREAGRLGGAAVATTHAFGMPGHPDPAAAGRIGGRVRAERARLAALSDEPQRVRITGGRRAGRMGTLARLNGSSVRIRLDGVRGEVYVWCRRQHVEILA